MTHLQVRRPKFDFSGDVPFMWNPQNAAFSFAINATSMVAICFEQMIVAAVQEAKPLLTDPAVAEEATAFLRQEAQHSSSHRKHVTALIRRYPGLQETFDRITASFDNLTATKPLAFRLAYIADLEATFTPTFKMMLDNQESLFRPGDDRVASLLIWHFVEEVEHRSCALVIYDAAVGRGWYRLRVGPSVVKHLISVMEIFADGVNAHVPLSDRQVDARSLRPAARIRAALQRHLPLRRFKSAAGVAPALQGVSSREKLIAVVRILLSQTPRHNPEHEPLPEFADGWLDRWERGGDVTRWYTAELAG